MSERQQVLEQGDIFFFYRHRLGREEVSDIDDVQRFYMVTAPDGGKYRLFIIGQKRLPEIIEGRSTQEERNWALNVLTTSDPEQMWKELVATEYETETVGRRKAPAAVPAGEGKYSIVKHGNHTELAYVLELPEMPGPAQKEFEIKKEASYIMAVKNPDASVNAPGFAGLEKAGPEYPEDVKTRFGDRRGMDAEPGILDYENTQVLLVGARKKAVREELDIDLNEEKENENTAELFRELRIRKEQVQLRPLLKGEFPARSDMASVNEREVWKKKAPERGSKVGQRVATTKVPSSASVAKILTGATFPMSKSSLLQYAKANKAKLGGAAEDAIEMVRGLPDRTYDDMADVKRSISRESQAA